MGEIESFLNADISRRRFIQSAAGLGLLVATSNLWRPSGVFAATVTSTGTGTTPEQVHLTWPFDSLNNPTNAVVVSWLQPQPSLGGFVIFAPATNAAGLTGTGTTTVGATVNTQQGGNLNGGATGAKPSPPAGSPSGTVPSGTFMGFPFSYQDQGDSEYIYAYSAMLTGLTPGVAYVYAVCDGNGNYFPTPAAPATFTTAPTGRAAFSFTSYGDLATPTAIVAGAAAGLASAAADSAGWQAGNFLSRLGVYSGGADGEYQPPSSVVGLLGGATPPVWSTYPWGCSGEITQSPDANGITGSCVDAVSIGAKLMIGFPMCGGVDSCTVTYAQVIAGERDADATYFASVLAANGCPDAMVRMGWEGNQSTSMGTPAQYVAAVQRLSPIMKAVAPDLQLIWNPTMNSGELATDLETYYPGDSYIDGVCLDFYDLYFYTNAGGPGKVGSAYPGIEVTWPYYLDFPAQGGNNNGTSLDWLVSFGAAHSKWIGFCECGLGFSSVYAAPGGDNPGFFTNLAAWTMANANLVKVITLWDSGQSSGFSSNNGNNVNSLAAIVENLQDSPDSADAATSPSDTPSSSDTYAYSTWAESSPNAYQAVNAVEYFAPLFHLLNGDLAYADKNATSAPEVWRDFGMSVQRSAMNRPWMPCLGNHEAEIANGYSSYLSRYVLPNNATAFPGNFYYFQVGSVLFISLDANDVVYQDSMAFASSTLTGSGVFGAGANCFDRYYSGTPSGSYATDTNLKAPAGNAQTVWLQNVLSSARPGLIPASPPSPINPISSISPTSIDWIVVQMHQCAMSSTFDNGCDKGIREIWKPLFDQYQVDLVVNGHDHDYERSQPVRGYNPLQGAAVATPSTPLETLQPAPVPSAISTTTASSGTVPLINSSDGTVYLVLGGGGTNAIDNSYQPTDGAPANTAGVHTVTIRKTTTQTKPTADAFEPAVWSAKTDPGNSPYGIALRGGSGCERGWEHHPHGDLLPHRRDYADHRWDHATPAGQQSRLHDLRAVRPYPAPERQPDSGSARVPLFRCGGRRSGGDRRGRLVSPPAPECFGEHHGRGVAARERSHRGRDGAPISAAPAAAGSVASSW